MRTAPVSGSTSTTAAWAPFEYVDCRTRQILRRRLEVVGGDRERLFANLGGGVGGRGAGEHADPAGERADAIRDARGVARNDGDLLERHREPVGDDLGQRGLVRLALARRAGEHEHPTDRVDANPDAFVRPEARVLDEERQAQADRTAFGPRPLALHREAVGAHGFGDAPQAFGIVPAVVAARAVVAGNQADVVRELVGLDQVARADRQPVEPEALGREIEYPLHHEYRLAAA